MPNNFAKNITIGLYLAVFYYALLAIEKTAKYKPIVYIL